MVKNSSGIMSRINTYIKSRDKFLVNNAIFNKYKDMSVEDLIAKYKDTTLSEEEQKFILETIYLKVFFYFPSFLSRKRYKLNSMLYDEALQNISKHILDAINRFDPSRGYPFLAYAYGDITAAMTRTFQELNTVRLPQGSKASRLKNFFKEDENFDMCKQLPDNNDGVAVDSFLDNPENAMAAASENPEKYVDTDISADVVLTSRNVLFTDASSSEIIDYDADLHNRQLVEWLEEALSAESGVLTEDERQVVILHNGLFGHDPLIYADIAKLRRAEGKGCSRSRISQIHTRALEKLRAWMSSLKIKD